MLFRSESPRRNLASSGFELSKIFLAPARKETTAPFFIFTRSKNYSDFLHEVTSLPCSRFMRWQFGFFSDDVGNFIHLQSISVHLRRQTRQASQKYGQSMYDVVWLLCVFSASGPIWSHIRKRSMEKRQEGKV